MEGLDREGNDKNYYEPPLGLIVKLLRLDLLASDRTHEPFFKSLPIAPLRGQLPLSGLIVWEHAHVLSLGVQA